MYTFIILAFVVCIGIVASICFAVSERKEAKKS